MFSKQQLLINNLRVHPYNFNIVPLCLLFFLNPFIAFSFSLWMLGKQYLTEKTVIFLLIIVSAYMGLLAYTQSSEMCDIQNYYRMIKNAVPADHSWSSFFKSIEISYLQDRYPIFAAINGFIYWSTTNVQLVSLFWLFIVYFCCFVGSLNLLKYYEIPLTPKALAPLIVGTVLCLIYFTQATEIIKQAVATSVFYYAYSLFILGKKRIAIVLILSTYFIHFSALFFLPWLLADKISTKKLWIITLISFVFRYINSMDLFVHLFSGFSFLGGAVERAQAYSTDMENFFQSGASYFVLAFFTLFISAWLVYKCNKRQNILMNCVLFMLIMLNLSYSTSHNFTRLLTLIYPVYCMLIVELLSVSKSVNRYKWLLGFMLLLNFVLNVRLAYARMSETSTWRTSYMNNSITKIVFSPVWSYYIFDFDHPEK